MEAVIYGVVITVVGFIIRGLDSDTDGFRSGGLFVRLETKYEYGVISYDFRRSKAEE